MPWRSDGDAEAERRALEIVRHRLLGTDRAARLGRFVLQGTLGRGAHGRVYAAFDPLLQRSVALKLIESADPAILQRGLAEARALASIRHPSLVQIFEVMREGDTLGIAMEKVEGVTLDAWLAQGRSVGQIVGVFERLADALAVLHDAGWVHRDVKPSNVLVAWDGTPKIIDLGLAIGARRAGEPRTSGTPRYMAPEQIRGIGIGPATDQYAWGIMLGEALRDRSRKGLQRVIARARAVDIEARYPDMRAARRALRRWRAIRRGAAMAVGLVLGSGPVLAWPTEPPCSSLVDTTDVGGMGWDDATARGLARTLSRGDGPLAEEIATTVVGRLEALHDATVEVELEACRRGRAENDEVRTCLTEYRSSFAATLDVLANFDGPALGEATSVVTMLGDPRGCLDRPALRPADGDLDRQQMLTLARVRGQLRGLGQACTVSTAAECRASFDTAARELRALPRCGVLPDLLLRRGIGLFEADDPTGALESLTSAAWEAEACGLAGVEFDAKRLSGALHAFGDRHDLAEVWLDAAEASLRRTGTDPYRRAMLELARGMATSDRAPARSVEHLQRARDGLEPYAASVPGDLEVLYVNLGQSLRKAGDPRASRALTDALDLQTELHGPRSRTVAKTLVSLAGAHHAAGRLDESLDALGRADAMLELQGPSARVERARVARNRGAVLQERGALADAAQQFEAALELAAAVRPSDRAFVWAVQQDLAITYALHGDLDRARRALEALLTDVKAGDAEASRLGEEVVTNLAVVELRRNAFDRAAELACPLAELAAEDSAGAPLRRLGRIATCAVALVELARHRDALDLATAFEEALPPSLQRHADAGELRFALARAHVAEGRLDRGRTLARAALDGLSADPQRTAEVERWLAVAQRNGSM